MPHHLLPFWMKTRWLWGLVGLGAAWALPMPIAAETEAVPDEEEAWVAEELTEVESTLGMDFTSTQWVHWQSVMDLLSATELPAIYLKDGVWWRKVGCGDRQSRMRFAYHSGWVLEVYQGQAQWKVVPIQGATFTQSTLILETTQQDLLVLPFQAEVGALEHEGQWYGLFASRYAVKRCW